MEEMEKRKLSTHFLKCALLLIMVAGFLDFLGFTFHLFWSLHYFDSLVHFIAGITVGMGSLWLLTLTTKQITKQNIFNTAVTGAIIVGVIWEIFELTNGITLLSDGIHYVTDTGADLIMDVTGGIVAAIYGWNVTKKYNIKNT